MFQLSLGQQKRHILHIDADAFFASVEQLVNPSLKGKAVLVGGPSEVKGIVSAASYEARAYGIKSGMPMYLAKRKCPQAVVVPGDFDKYREISRRMRLVMLDYTPDVEMASIDEAYLDVSGCEQMHGLLARDLVKKMLLDIYKRVGISVSCGMASSKVVAKVASGLNKPHKFTVVPYGKEKEFLAPLPLRAMPGIGPRTCAVLERRGLRVLGDLSGMKLDEVYRVFGVHGIPLWKRAQGIDNSLVKAERALPKSISKEHTFYQAMWDEKVLLRAMRELSRKVFFKLRQHKMKAKTVCVKIKYVVPGPGGKKFQWFSFQKHLDLPSAVDGELFAVARELLRENLAKDKAVRLIGIGVSGLIQNYNLNLFQADEVEDALFEEIDKLRMAYGEDSLKVGI